DTRISLAPRASNLRADPGLPRLAPARCARRRLPASCGRAGRRGRRSLRNCCASPPPRSRAADARPAAHPEWSNSPSGRCPVTARAPQFSVLIVNWNGRHFLDDCLGALRQQSCRDFETILVDNGSTDGSLEHLARAFPEVRVVALGENRGFQAANAEGLLHSCGEVIVLLNNDTEAAPNWLAALAQAASRYGDAGSFA